MNGTVASLTEYGCDGEETELVEPLYTVINEMGEPVGVNITGLVGHKPGWDAAHCNSTGCFLPEYFFDEVERDPRTCPEDGSERSWVMVLD